MDEAPTPIEIEVAAAGRVAGSVYLAPERTRLGVTLMLAPGAGAPHTSAFMVLFGHGLAARGLDVVTFNFPYQELRRRVPDRTEILETAYLAAIERAVRDAPLADNRLFIGGKSLGGRMASHLGASRGDLDLGGLVFLGYPLHPPAKPTQLRAAHLRQIVAPMLFVQGSRDSFGTPDELRPVLAPLGTRARVYIVEGGDHSLKVPKSAPITQQDVYERVQNEIRSWIEAQTTMPAA